VKSAIATIVCLGVFASACGTTAPTLIDPPVEPVATPTLRRLERPSRSPVIVEPPAARQMKEGYWLGAMLEPEHVPWLSATGIRVVLSAVRPSHKTLEMLARWGIEDVSVPMSSSFRHSDVILAVADSYEPSEIFIHCRHGADRTGAIAAFLLVVRHGWSIPDAFFSVLYRDQSDIDGLTDVLAHYGFVEARPIDDPSIGFYSVTAAGGVGGLKVRNARYARLVETTLDTIMTLIGSDLSS